jgi:hypothetical protein
MGTLESFKLLHLLSLRSFCQEKNNGSPTEVKTELFSFQEEYFYNYAHFSISPMHVLTINENSYFRDVKSYPIGSQSPPLGRAQPVGRRYCSTTQKYGPKQNINEEKK